MSSRGLNKILQEDSSLVWYTKNTSNLSDESVLEHVLNYGTWKQVQEVLGILGLKGTVDLYHSIVNKPRCNLKPRVKYYFDLYFSHAFGNIN